MVYRPMEGVRVLEVAQFTFTPSASAVLADWGADVIKVEHAERGDAQRGLRHGSGGLAAGTFRPMMEHPNRGKRSIGLALENQEALEVLYGLARQADVFLVNFLPAARLRLKIEVEDLRRANPNIIYVRGSAHGNHGPERENGGYDAGVFWSRMGSAYGSTPSESARITNMPASAYGDTMGGMTIAGGIAAALYARERTGHPSEIDVSLLSVGAWAMAPSVNSALLMNAPLPPVPLDLSTATNNPLVATYKTADGRFLTMTMLQAGRYWEDFCQHIDREDLIKDPRFATAEALMDPANTAAAAKILVKVFGSQTYDYWVRQLQTMEGQWSPVQNSLEVGHDAQLRANGYIRTVIDLEGNERELVANPVQFDNMPPDITRAPQFAEHTDDILAEQGYDEEKILAMKIAGAVT
jgi:crotonobetainyl-CoA:carnitine CoA-transferase CaiB-like acyl-CoA transferase